MLTIEHLNCGYGKHEILHDISVTIPDKKITAIVGQSGCGKTTFLKTLNRMVEEEQGYTTGKISLGDADIKFERNFKKPYRHGLPAADCFSTQY